MTSSVFMHAYIDIDQTSLFRAAGLPYSVTIASSHQVLPLMRDAISMALSQSCCVHIALPFDLQYQVIKVTLPHLSLLVLVA